MNEATKLTSAILVTSAKLGDTALMTEIRHLTQHPVALIARRTRAPPRLMAGDPAP
jgi:uncharacterized protein (DUF2336 family)